MVAGRIATTWLTEYPGVETAQIIYNIFRQRPDERFFDLAAEANTGIIVRLPLTGGLLTGKMSEDTVFAPDDHRSYNRSGAAFDVGEALNNGGDAKRLESAVSTVIPGAKNANQAIGNAAASDVPPIDAATMAAIDAVYEGSIASTFTHAGRTGQAYRHAMRIGYQGEPGSYSYRAVGELFAAGEPIGLLGFATAFAALEEGEIDRLVVPVENSTTGSVLPVLDRLPGGGGHQPFAIVAEHLVEVRHAILGIPGAPVEGLAEVRSHPQALAQAERHLLDMGVEAVARPDTAGAVREVAELGDPSIAALAPPGAAEIYGLDMLVSEVMDRAHNTTRFVVLAPGAPQVDPDDDKTTILFTTSHTPGALALVLAELGLRGANLTRIESRPSTEAWSYRFFVDLVHDPGTEGLARVIDPPPATCANLWVLGSYVRAAG